MVDGKHPRTTAGFENDDYRYFRLTEEGAEVIEQYMGEERMADDILYGLAVMVLQRLNKHQVTEAIDWE